MTTYVDRAEWRVGSPAICVVPSLDGAVPPVSDEERDLVCQAIDRHGLWGSDIPAMLGLVES